MVAPQNEWEELVKKYSPPQQARAIETERMLLGAFLEELDRSGFEDTNLSVVAKKAGITRPGLLRRFGSKRGLLLVLYDRYCDDCVLQLRHFKADFRDYASLASLIQHLYIATERMHQDNYSLNLAMSQMYFSELAPANGTKRVFKEFLSLFGALEENGWYNENIAGTYAGIQIIISTSLNYTLGAMGGFPRDQNIRAQLVSRLVIEALRKE